jgi:hypothetical protein
MMDMMQAIQKTPSSALAEKNYVPANAANFCFLAEFIVE